MDVREKYVMQKVNRKEKSICPNCIHHNLCIAENNQPCFECNRFIDANGVTVQEWISVDDRLPQYTDEYNVTVGVPSEFGYFEKVKTLRFERIKGKEPRWVIPKNEIYNVIAWMELPKKYQPPKGE